MYFDHNTSKLKSVISDNWNVELGTPVGIIVIPRSHRSNGHPVMMSLAEKQLSFAKYPYDRIDIAGITNQHENAVYSYEYPITEISEAKRNKNDDISKIFPSDVEEGREYALSDKLRYSYDIVPETASDSELKDYPFWVSQYNSDGSYNEKFGKYLFDTKENGGEKEKGKENTKAVIDYLVEKGDSYDNMTFPAFEWCYSYKTIGTTSGSWFLPSIEELSYLMTFSRKINASLSKISEFNVDPLKLNDNGIYYISSSEYNDRSKSDYISMCFSCILGYSYIYCSAKYEEEKI